MKKTVLFLSMMLVLTLSGCTSFQAMSSADRARIHRLYVSDTVKMPDSMFYWDRARSVAVGIGAGVGVAAGAGSSSSSTKGALIGVGAGMGAVVGEQMSHEPSQKILQAMHSSLIDIGALVRQDLMDELVRTGKMELVDEPGKADATLVLEVEMYGFGQTQGFSSILYPVLRVDARIADTADKRVWQKADYIVPLSKKNKKGNTFEEYLQNPRKIRENFSIASKAVAGNIVAELPSGMP